jgi:hypothetical protein
VLCVCDLSDVCCLDQWDELCVDFAFFECQPSCACAQ